VVRMAGAVSTLGMVRWLDATGPSAPSPA
jgi:hypothetical protein